HFIPLQNILTVYNHSIRYAFFSVMWKQAFHRQAAPALGLTASRAPAQPDAADPFLSHKIKKILLFLHVMNFT
ncbi:hypothetical protein ACN6US_002704, partial [Cronobacter sakazakii]